jgi:autotransporter translocation and assembly factor TamB
MFRRPLVIFLLLVSILIGGSVIFLQSRVFAGMVRGFLSRTVPRELGVSAEFTDFQLQVFPPGVSVRNPELRLEEKNFLGLPKDSVLKAGRIDLKFRPFQMLWGNIRIEQVRLVDSDISLELGRRDASPNASLRWSELIQVRLQSIAMEQSRIRLRWPSDGIELQAKIQEAQVWRLENGGEHLFSLDASTGAVELLQGGKASSLASVGLSADFGPSGVQLRTLDALIHEDGSKTTLRASGAIRGDLLNPKSLKSSIRIEAEGDAAALLDWIPSSKEGRKSRAPAPHAPIQGRFVLRGELAADLLRIRDSANFDGKIELASGQAHGWRFERADAELRIRSESGKGADIEIQSANILGPDKGRVLLGRSRFSVRSSGLVEDVSIPLQLERAGLSWLTGPYATSVENLDLQLSGELAMTLKTGRRWSLHSRADLQAGVLRLLSTTKTQGGPRNLILSTVPSRIQGTFVVDSGRFSPEQLQWKFEHSLFDISGEVDWTGSSTQWNLKANGAAQLSDLDELGHSKIQGHGRLATHVHGPSENLAIDFDAELSDAVYLNMNFGALRGRFSLVEEQNVLRFSAVQGRQAETSYVVSGPIDFRGDGRMDLEVSFPNGRAEDFLAIFHPLTRELAWFPQSLKGRLKAIGRVHGGLSLAQMKVETKIDGTDWSFFGERFRSIQFAGGYDQGTYFMKGLDARKRSGAIFGSISYDARDRLDWNFKTQGFSLRDFDWMLRLAIPIRGDVQVSTEGSGTLEALESTTQISLTRTVIRSRSFPQSLLRVTTRQGVWGATGSGLGEQVRIDWAHDPRASASNSLKLSLNSADFSPLMLLLNPKSVQDLTLAGRATGSIELAYPGTHFDRASGKLVVSEFLARKEGASLQIADPVAGRMVQGDLSMPDIRILSDRGSVARLSLSTRQGRWSCSLNGEADLSSLEFLTSLVQQASGKAELDVELRGLLSAPEISGKLDINEGYIRTTALDSPLENLQGRFMIRSGKVLLSGFQADLAQGRASAGGQIEFFTDRFPALDLTAQLDENRLKVYPFQFLKLRQARLKIAGTSLPYDITGNVNVEQGLSREKLSGSGQGVSLQSTLYAPPPTGDVAFDFPKFRLRIDVTADSGLKFQNELLDVEMRAAVTVVNTIEAPRLLGKAELVPGQGRMTFKDHIFQVQSALVKFDNPAVLNPVFDLVATTDISGTKVQLYTSGTADRFKVELSSNPVLPEPEILSLLAMGRTLEESQRLRAGSTSGVQQSEAASLILQSLDFNREVREKTGFQVGVGEAVDTQAGMSIFRPQGDLESSIAPKIVLKRQIGKRVDVSVGSTVGSGTTNQREVNADFYISPTVSVRGVWNFFEGSTSQDTSTTTLQQSRTSYGVDLKLQKRFK